MGQEYTADGVTGPVREEDLDPRTFIALEEKLSALRQEHGIAGKVPLWIRVGDAIVEYREKKKALVNRKKYITLALSCGWFCGAHRFYAGQYISGMLYLLFCWTGIPLSMTFIDLMIALPKEADHEGEIEM